LSDIFERNRASYYDALMRVRAANDMTHWIRFFLNGVAQTATKGRDVFGQILKLRTEVEKAVLGLGKRAHTARMALSLLYRQPIINAGDVEKALSVSTPTANALIKSLVELDILNEITGQQRWRSYAFEAYLKLFLS
jgi:Fic family protein